MSISSSFLDELRMRLPIDSIIGRRVRLVRYSNGHVGLCPFHKEKNPSFTVNGDKGFFHCFGCGAHGDVIGFVMRIDSLSFLEAVEYLSREAKLDIQKTCPDWQVQEHRPTILLEMMEMATSFFERHLRLPVGQTGLEYLHKRGLEDTLITEFRLGFAPNGNVLKAALKREGFNESLAVEAGLLIKPDSERATYDTFRSRIMFPVTDSYDRVIAFGGRALADIQPKYLNSPDTVLFQKRKVLYGLTKARSHILEKGIVVVTEGYTDVTALVGADFHYVVASLGTSLTEEQITTLWRLVPEPILCFDGDTAGRRAASRTAKLVLPLLKPGLSVRFALLPDDKDPDDLIRTKGAQAIALCFSRAIPLFENVWQTLLSGRIFNTPERQAALEQEIDSLTGHITNQKIRSGYRSLLHERRRTLLRHLHSRQNPRRYISQNSTTVRRLNTTPPQMQDLAYSLFTAFLLAYPHILMRHLEQAAEMLTGSKNLATLIEMAAAILDEQPELDGNALTSALKHSGQTSILATLRHDFISVLQMHSSDPEAEYQHMVLALHDQALVREIETTQAVFATNPSIAVWQRLLFLQGERYRLHIETT